MNENFERENVVIDKTFDFETVVSLRVLFLIAKACHEVNRSWCDINGDSSQDAWHLTPKWQQDSAVKGVLGVSNGNGPEESHASWMKEKLATGWKYGSVKDAKQKEHPCIMAYSELPPEQKIKDHLFVTTAKALLSAYENTKTPD